MLDRPENITEKTTSDEQGLLLEEVKISLNEENHLDSSPVIITSFSEVTELMKDFNKYTSFANKMGKATIPTALISLAILATSTYFYSLDTDKNGLLFLSIVSGVLAMPSSIAACYYYRDPSNSRFMECVHPPSDYDTKKTKALKLIEKFNVNIKDDSDPFAILNGLIKVKSIIRGTIKQRKSAITTSLVPTMFNTIKRGTAGYSICEEIFEYAGLSKPKNIR